MQRLDLVVHVVGRPDETGAALVAALKSGGKRAGFVRDRHGNPVDQRTATIEQLID